MKIRVSNRLALLAACGVVVSALGAVHVPATATYASPSRAATAALAPQAARSTAALRSGLGASVPLSAANFQPISLPGFGDPQNTWAWSMQSYKNHLLVGTNREWGCTTQASLNHSFPGIYPYPPPPDPDIIIPCNPDPHALSESGQIWSLDLTGSQPFTQANWTQVYQSPYGGPYLGKPIMVNDISSTTGMTPAARDMAFRGMTVYTDRDGQQALYVSGVGTSALNGANVPPPSLLRTTDGTAFKAVPSDPGTVMGSINVNALNPGACCLRGAVSYNGKFYVVVSDILDAGAVYVSSDPRLGDNSFQQLTPAGMKVVEIQPFNGHLYLGVQGYSTGYTVLRIDGPCPTLPCPSSAFTQIVPGGGGLGGNGDYSITSMHVFTDAVGIPHLYVGTDGAGFGTPHPAEIIRVNQDDQGNDPWDLIVGDPRSVTQQFNGITQTVTLSPTSGLRSGFGWWFNLHMWRMEDYNGVLYVGTFDASSAAKDTPSGPKLEPYMGFDLAASVDGKTFTTVTTNGFGDKFNAGDRSLVAVPGYGLFVGTANDWEGTHIYLGSVPPAALHLAATNVQINPLNGGKATALAWDAPPNATRFHVYRATVTQMPLPPSAVNSDPELRRAAARHKLPRTIALPGQATEIGTTTAPYFVDRQVQAGTHYTYYVVAEDGHGHRAAPSNVASDPALTPAPTFQDVEAALGRLGRSSTLPASQRTAVQDALRAAYARMQAGDAQGGHDLLSAARLQVLARAQGPLARLYASNLATLLDGLAQRAALVHAGVLTTSQLK